MRGVAEQRQPAKRPARQRILIDHRIFQDGVGACDEFRHVEPIEMPVGHGRQEVFQTAAAIPVARLVDRRLDVADPVHQLAAFGVDIVADRVDQQLGRMVPADADHAGAGQERLPARDAAPHVDAGIFRRPSFDKALGSTDGCPRADTARPCGGSGLPLTSSKWRWLRRRHTRPVHVPVSTLSAARAMKASSSTICRSPRWMENCGTS